MLDWLINTDSGLAARIAAGVVVLSILAILDLRKHGRSARCWREYLFLLLCVGVALAYGIINDQLTVGISWEYFYYGKDIGAQLGPKTPPEAWALRWAAAKVGMKATWTAGLILGVIILFANNPTRTLAPLPFSRVTRKLPLMLTVTAACAMVLGIVGRLGGLIPFNDDFRMLIKDDMWRPYRFMTVYGIHLGGYVGGLLGAIAAAISIQYERRAIRKGGPSDLLNPIKPERH